jgi:Na+/proline symporter
MTVMFWPVVVFMAISLAIGLYTYTQVRGSSHNFTVCGKAMPFFIIGTALVAQAVDGNATLGNSSLTYSSGIWTGLMIPIGLAVSLFVVGRFLAAPLNRMNLTTLPEYFFRRYDQRTELLVSVLTVVCFTVLIAGNLAAVGWIISVACGVSYGTGLLTGTAIIAAYTIAGGLFSAIWTDLFQIHVALIGFVASAGWVLATRGWAPLMASVPPERLSLDGLVSLQSGALTNWAGMISLAFGNAMALDFMERVFAAKSPETARRGCYYAGALTMVIGSCATILGLAAISSVGKVDDPRMVLPLFGAAHVPYWMGAMVFVGVLGASMSTANGAILVISVVLARNIYQRWTANEVSDSRLLLLSRLMAIPTAIAGALVAWRWPEPGILLVVAFDIVFAGCVVPLFCGVYWRKASSGAAIAAIIAGTSCRLVAHFVTPAPWAGLDTLIPPVVSALVFVSVTALRAPALTEATEISPSSV